MRLAAVAGLLVLALTSAPAALATHNEPLRGQWHLDAVDVCPSTCTATSDSSGHGLDAVQIASPAQVAGRFGNAFTFKGQLDAFDAGSSPELQPPIVTLLAWVNSSGDPGTIRAIAGQGADGTCSHASYALYTGSPPRPGLQFYIWTGAQLYVSPNAGSGMWDGAWHMVAGTYDGATVRLYLDGQEVGSGTPATGSISYGLASDHFTIGNYANPHECAPSNTNFPGGVDETRVYSRALTAPEIARLAAAPGRLPPVLVPDPHVTSTSLGCSPGSVVVGQAAVCTVTVVDGGPQPSVPVGSVSFATDSPGAFSPGACSLAATGVAGQASCAVSYTPSAVAAGKHALRASYPGDLSHMPSSGGTNLVIDAPPPGAHVTSASLSCSPGSVVVGQAAVCTVTVVDGGPQPSVPVGSVSFATDSPGAFSPGACSLAATGVAGQASCAVSYTPSAVAAGKHALRASYPGDLSHMPSSGGTGLVIVSRAPPPRLGKSVTVAAVAGRVLVRAPGAGSFFVLSVGETIPVGSLVDATHGTVRLSSARDRHGHVQSAQFWEGQFRVTQQSGRGGFTNLTLTASMSGCAGASSEAGIARRRPRRHLWGSGSGSYGTTGQYSSASVHGTKWLVEDRCGETITRVVKGVVTVNDFTLHRTLLVHAGHSYTAHKRH